MTGYQEILTDPPTPDGRRDASAHRQLRRRGRDMESSRRWAEAFVIKELASKHSNHRANESLDARLSAAASPSTGSTRGASPRPSGSTGPRASCVHHGPDAESLVAKAKAATSTDGQDLAQGDLRGADDLGRDLRQLLPRRGRRLGGRATEGGRLRPGARNILRSLVHFGFDVTVVPATTPPLTSPPSIPTACSSRTARDLGLHLRRGGRAR